MRAKLTTIGAAVALAAAPVAAGAPPPASATSPSVASVACGAGGGEALATSVGEVGERIYASELGSSETASDRHQIESYAPLLSALESDERGAIEAAVHGLVYSHTHIVRLRVDRGSQLVADVGGPYILAPVAGTLRSHGRTIGHFVFSVQDDLGYVKLVTRFIGVPLVLRTDSGQVPIEGLLSPGPAKIPDRGPVSYHGMNYEAYSFVAEAYPSGRLRVSLLVPLTRSLQTRTCERIRTDEFGIVAQRLSRRFALSPSSYPPYIRLLNSLTHALVYVRAGSRTLAGSTRSAPPKLPTSGALRWHGARYEVASFEAPSSTGPVHVYVLVAR
ncbi:MAG TPA: hypothetical protein VGX69_10955 [Solirubrobacteraceae bacterium]|nr:hypothetical protein [Solirubrobacteraceae bacterium]